MVVAHLAQYHLNTLYPAVNRVIRFIPVRSLNERVLESQSVHLITTCCFSGPIRAVYQAHRQLVRVSKLFPNLALFGQLMHRFIKRFCNSCVMLYLTSLSCVFGILKDKEIIKHRSYDSHNSSGL